MHMDAQTGYISILMKNFLKNQKNCLLYVELVFFFVVFFFLTYSAQFIYRYAYTVSMCPNLRLDDDPILYFY